MTEKIKNIVPSKEIKKAAIGLLLSLGMTYCIIFWVFRLLYPEVVHAEVALAFAGIFLYVFNLVSMFLFFRLLKTMPKYITMYYLLHKTLRLIISLGIIIIYGLLYADTIKLFALEFFLFYIITMVFESVHFFKLESKMKIKNENK